MTSIAMIPARMGSQRLKQKNLAPLRGEPLLTHAIRKCLAAGVFDEVWVNSEHPTFGEIAVAEGARFHKRPEELANNVATSEAGDRPGHPAHGRQILRVRFLRQTEVHRLAVAERLEGFIDDAQHRVVVASDHLLRKADDLRLGQQRRD